MKTRTWLLYVTRVLILGMLSRVQAENSLQPFDVLQDKLESGRPVTVAYLGGSITVGAMTHPITGTGIHGPYDYSQRRDES